MTSRRAATVLVEGASLTLNPILAEHLTLSWEFARIPNRICPGGLRAAVEKRTGPLH